MRTGGNESGGRRWEGLRVLRVVFGAGKGVLSYIVRVGGHGLWDWVVEEGKWEASLFGL
jgi:hypothetical protein